MNSRPSRRAATVDIFDDSITLSDIHKLFFRSMASRKVRNRDIGGLLDIGRVWTLWAVAGRLRYEDRPSAGVVLPAPRSTPSLTEGAGWSAAMGRLRNVLRLIMTPRTPSRTAVPNVSSAVASGKATPCLAVDATAATPTGCMGSRCAARR